MDNFAASTYPSDEAMNLRTAATLIATAIMPTVTHAQTDSIPDQTLGEITIIANAPAARVTADRTVYDLRSSVTGDTGTLMDALSSIPGVSVSDDGAVSLYGNQGAALIVDGQKTYLKGRELANYLRSLPASLVSTISLRSTVSAKDDATDRGGIIEISTRRQRDRGFSLSANSSISAWRNLSGNGSINTAFNTGRSEFSLLYSFFTARRSIRLDIDRYYLTDVDRMFQLSTRRKSDNAHTVKAGWLYNFTPDSRLGVNLTASRNVRNELGRMNSDIPVLDEQSRSKNHNRSRWQNLMADLYFQHSFDSGAELSAGANILSYRTTEHQTSGSSQPDTLRSAVRGKVNWYIGRLDWSMPITGGFKLEAGAKSTFVFIRNSGAYDDRTDGSWVHNPSMSSTFRYRANTNATYAQISFSRGPVSATVGTRLEHEKLRGAFSGNEAAADTSYRVSNLDLIPSATVKLVCGSDLALMLSYSRRLQRPNYIDLNPFIYIFDEFTHSGGNISLHSSVTDNLQLGLAWRGRLQCALFFSRSDDAIMKGYHEISDRTVYVASENIPLYLRTGIRITLANQPIGRRWDLTAIASAIYNRYDWPDGDRLSSTRRLTPMLSLDNRFTLGRGWSAELKGSFTGRMALGQVSLRSFGSLDAAVRKSLFSGRGALTLFVRDIFATDRSDVIVMLNGHRSTLDETEFKRMAGISFSYKFRSGRKTRKSRAPEEPEELKRL